MIFLTGQEVLEFQTHLETMQGALETIAHEQASFNRFKTKLKDKYRLKSANIKIAQDLSVEYLD